MTLRLDMPSRALSPRVFLSLAAVLCCLGGCHREAAQTGDGDDAALRKAGYSRAPQVTGVEQGGGDTYIVSGVAIPDGRVRFDYGGDRAIGVTADARGHFRAPLPGGPDGGLYDLSIEDSGRLMHAEGRLFIPPHHPEKAALIRAGAPSQSLIDTSPIAVVDYDAAGAIAISGHIATKNIVNVMIDGDIRAQVRPDAGHAYSALSQIAPPTRTPATVALEVQADGRSATRTISVSLPAAGGGDRMSAIPGGWRVDAVLPGGGMQTTLVF